MPTAALYVRVSTDRQTGENQIAELRQLAAARGFEPVIYEEIESAAKARRRARSSTGCSPTRAPVASARSSCGRSITFTDR